MFKHFDVLCNSTNIYLCVQGAMAGWVGGLDGRKTVSAPRDLASVKELDGCPTNCVIINQDPSALRKQRRED